MQQPSGTNKWMSFLMKEIQTQIKILHPVPQLAVVLQPQIIMEPSLVVQHHLVQKIASAASAN